MATVAMLLAAGIVESARNGLTGLTILLCIIELIVLSFVFSLRSRPPVALRPDLNTWVERTSALTGESPSRLTDRAVSAYRAATDDRSEH